MRPRVVLLFVDGDLHFVVLGHVHLLDLQGAGDEEESERTDVEGSGKEVLEND